MSLHTDDIVIANTPLSIDGNNPNPVTITGTVTTSAPTSNSATVTQVSLSAGVNNTLLASNASRKGAIIFIPIAGTYIKFGTTASSTSFTYQTTVPNSTIEIPFGYTGRIDAINAISTTITITELS